MKIKELFLISGIPVFIASLCCLTPIILVFFGLATVSFAAYLTGILEGQFQWAFILAGLIFMTLSLIVYFRKEGICTIDQYAKRKNEVINKVLLVVISAILGYILFFYVFLDFIGKWFRIWS